MVEIFDDRIEISSPGGLVKGLLEKDFGKKSVLRNANIANLFQRLVKVPATNKAPIKTSNAH